ncbi:hypothetical protein T265_04655 [Opisthorchis viverrini]|uniref:Uncharacterized protein n=1 Tax=Opisthorchis viverrini TaxID=6198 RepID=A0A074ZM98_OPIVI|nr:hypothetical protein T265_04655 [Opisthorchis viverrini]KER28518.1 hypothetical protein T265_04655 [Opisthorchis viverrini]
MCTSSNCSSGWRRSVYVDSISAPGTLKIGAPIAFTGGRHYPGNTVGTTVCPPLWPNMTQSGMLNSKPPIVMLSRIVSLMCVQGGNHLVGDAVI